MSYTVEEFKKKVQEDKIKAMAAKKRKEQRLKKFSANMAKNWLRSKKRLFATEGQLRQKLKLPGMS